MKKSLSLIFFFFLIILSRPTVFSHCEIPCGIYNDEMRFAQIKEHIKTIEKSIHQVIQLSKESPQNMNQTIRWIMNKEKHAEEIQHIVSQYFLTQRIKSPDLEEKQAAERYSKNLILCHQILVYSMKSKQTTDLDNVKKLRSTVEQFKKAYFAK